MNNDGYLDLAANNGWDQWETIPEIGDSSRLFLNQDGGTSPFLDVSDEAQFNDTEYGSALIAFDFDRDGDLDIMEDSREWMIQRHGWRSPSEQRKRLLAEQEAA